MPADREKDDYAEIREALGAVPKIEPWFVVGPPWGKGDWVIAGHNDPHLGRYVCDTENFDGEKPHSLEYATYIAACNPTAIRALLNERDALRQALEKAAAGIRRGITGGTFFSYGEAHSILAAIESALTPKES